MIKEESILKIGDDVLSSLRYDDSSPTKLVWAVERLKGKGNAKTKVGDVAGFKSARYFKVEVNGTAYAAHRIVYTITKGEIPVGFVIDHINRDGFDNSPENLVAKKQIQNTRNQRKRSNNTSGVTGVTKEPPIKGCSYWCAVWNDLETGKQKRKRFRIERLGDEVAFMMACQYRKDMLHQLNLGGAGYSDNHGQ